MMSCNMPWRIVQSWVGLGNSQETETCRGDQVTDCSKSLDPRRWNREAHDGLSESAERRGRSERQNADECGRMSPTLGCTCRPGTTAACPDHSSFTLSPFIIIIIIIIIIVIVIVIVIVNSLSTSTIYHSVTRFTSGSKSIFSAIISIN